MNRFLRRSLRLLCGCFASFILVSAISSCGSGASGGNDKQTSASLSSTAEYRGQLLSYSLIRQFMGLKIYKVSYATLSPSGSLIKASGAVGLPSALPAKGIFSVQHGTISRYSDAPSEAGGTLNEGMPSLYAGAVLVMADYVGFGDSKNYLHPYHHAAMTASASLDMLRAAKTFLRETGVEYKDTLMLAGYSEGGFATMALQREIETNTAGEFTVATSFLGAGAYDLYGTARTHFANETQASPAYLVFVMLAYNDSFGLGRANSTVLNEPYASLGSSLFDGSKTIDEINQSLTSVTANLFNPAFLSDFNGSGEAQIKDLLRQNSVYEWTPRAETILYHGKGDEIVPYQNAATAYNYFVNNGAPNVSLVNCEYGATTHNDCGRAFYDYIYQWLNNRSS